MGLFITSKAFSCLDVVTQKYPLTPHMALRKARDSANQAGRERQSYLNRVQMSEHTADVTLAAIDDSFGNDSS